MHHWLDLHWAGPAPPPPIADWVPRTQLAVVERPGVEWTDDPYPNEALPQTDEACGACGWFVSFLVGLRQGLVKLEIFPEATLA